MNFAPPRHSPARATASFCRVYGCQNVLTLKSTDFCHDPHRAEYHKTARHVGRGVIAVVGYEEALEFKKQCDALTQRREGTKQARGFKIKLRQPRPEKIDMDVLRP